VVDKQNLGDDSRGEVMHTKRKDQLLVEVM